MKVMQAVGAYGRKATKKDWTAGKDFRVINGPYFSSRDIDTMKQNDYRAIEFYDQRNSNFLFAITL